MSNASYSPTEAWLAFDNQDYVLAETLWLGLMSQTSRPGLQNKYRLNYTYVLGAQQRFQEALDILQELFEDNNHPSSLHQMGFISQEQGDLVAARSYLQREKAYLLDDDNLSLAAHTCALGRVLLLQKEYPAALEQAQSSLGYAHAAADEPILKCAAHYLIGDIMTAQMKDEEARDHYTTAYATNGQSTRQPAMLLTRKFQQT